MFWCDECVKALVGYGDATSERRDIDPKQPPAARVNGYLRAVCLVRAMADEFDEVFDEEE